MNPLSELLQLDIAARRERGIEHTPAEIAQQPDVWRETARLVAGSLPLIAEWLDASDAGDSEIIFAGAGSSDFVGRSVAGLLTSALERRVLPCATTDIVSHPDLVLFSQLPALLVSIARSGNSPESVAAVEIALQEYPQLLHLVITCNPNGKLAQLAANHPGRMTALVLPPRTNDQGLAMTSSFTSMVIASQALAYFDSEPSEYVAQVDRLATAAERLLADGATIAKAAVTPAPERACFLGAGTLLGCAAEAHLKLQELTDGRTICLFDSFLGIRHGPQAAIRDQALVVSMLSSDPYARQYEVDLLRENRAKGLGKRHIAIMDRRTAEVESLVDDIIELDPDGTLAIPDALRPPVDVIFGQLLGLFASLDRGLKPDSPSRAGVISRVVQGVTIYPRPTN